MTKMTLDSWWIIKDTWLSDMVNIVSELVHYHKRAKNLELLKIKLVYLIVLFIHWLTQWTRSLELNFFLNLLSNRLDYHKNHVKHKNFRITYLKFDLLPETTDLRYIWKSNSPIFPFISMPFIKTSSMDSQSEKQQLIIQFIQKFLN